MNSGSIKVRSNHLKTDSFGKSVTRPFLWGIFALLIMIFAHATSLKADDLFSTYFGGRNYDGAYAVAIDSSGNIYIGGSTASITNFPVLNAYQPSYAGGYADAFLAKFDPDGHLLFSTYFGGSGYEAVNDLAIDPQGNLLVVGETRSVDLPTTENAFQPDYAGGSAFGYGDGFIAKFTSDGSSLLYCSYFGGSGDEKINDSVLHADGSLYITGQTDSKNLPLRTAFQQEYGGGDSDGYLAK